MEVEESPRSAQPDPGIIDRQILSTEELLVEMDKNISEVGLPS